MGKPFFEKQASAAAVIAVLLAVAVIGGCTGVGEGSNGTASNVAATVNGVNISIDEVNAEYASLSPGQRVQFTKADALSFIIEREILYQQAVKEGITATKEAQQQEYLYLLAAENVTEQGLAMQLSAKNSSLDELKASLYRQILIDKLLETHTQLNFAIKRGEVEALYNASDFRSLNISFAQAENGLVNYLTAQKRKAQRDSYVSGLKDRAEVLIIAVPN